MNGSRVAMLAALLVLSVSLPWSGGPREASASSAGRGPTSTFLPSPPFGPPREIVLYAHAKTLVRRLGHWEHRVDPALFLSGLTAQRAAVEDGAIGPGEAVPNDFYTRDESHRLLTFRVAPGAHVTVMTRGPKATPITVPELARALAGKPTPHRLFEPQAGFWIRVAGDTVRGIDQQYTP